MSLTSQPALTATTTDIDAEINRQRLPAFKEHPDAGYRPRTLANAAADLTIAIAADMSTAGERLTKSAVLEQGKVYCPIQYRGESATEAAVLAIQRAIQSIDKREITVNIAGNGIYTLDKMRSVGQEEVDRYTFELLSAVVRDLGDKKIGLIRSGGQTGFDEAGIKAGMSLDIPTEVLAPKGWKLRDAKGIDHADEVAFKARFVLHGLKLKYHDKTYGWHTYCYAVDDHCDGWEAYGLKRTDAGLLVMEHIAEDAARALAENVHAYFDYEMVILDIRGCVGYRRMFKNVFHIREALEDFEDDAIDVTRKLTQ